MRCIRWAGIALVAVLLADAARAGDAGRDEYVVAQSIDLRRADGRAVALQVLVDRRLTRRLRAEFWGGGWDMTLESGSPLYREFSARPPRNARLVLRDATGSSTVVRELRVSLARLERWPPLAGEDVFLLTEDFSIGAGSFNGPASSLILVDGAAVRDVTAVDDETHTEEPVRFHRSMRSAWRMARRDGREVLWVSSFPDLDEPEPLAPDPDYPRFLTRYVRYRFEGGRWTVHRRKVVGAWDDEHPFPERAEFR